MNKILCVTCLRDFYILQRQIESFRLYLSENHEIIYIVEDIDPTKWFQLWNEYEYNHSNLKNKISIILANQLIPDYLRTIRGWQRQQILKLYGVMAQNQTCTVIDSKNFLIKYWDNDNRLILRDQQLVDRSKSNTYETVILPVYEKIVGITVDRINSLVTPIDLDPDVITEGINNWPSDFSEWWRDSSLTYGWQSEFYLYYLWYVKQNRNTLMREYRVRNVWNDNFAKCMSILKKTDFEKVEWVGIRANITNTWDNLLKEQMLEWLNYYGLVGKWNLIDLGK
jgi:hypothetical protein